MTEGPAARCRSRASSSLQTAAAGPQRARDDTRSGSRNRHHSLASDRAARASAGRGGARGRRGEAGGACGGAVPPRPGPQPSFRRAPPRPASCGLARPRCHVGLCGCRRRRCRRRGRRVGGGVGSLAQSPECEGNDHRARAQPGGSWELPLLRAALRRLLLPVASLLLPAPEELSEMLRL